MVLVPVRAFEYLANQSPILSSALSACYDRRVFFQPVNSTLNSNYALHYEGEIWPALIKQNSERKITHMKKLFVAVFMVVFLAGYSSAWAHPGRTNAQGCHTNKKTGEYHCHGTKTAPAKKQAPAQKAPEKAKTKDTVFEATVIRVSDGDTITVQNADYEQIRVRLYGIDAPENKQPGGAEATAFLMSLQGQTVKVTEMDTDRYSRMVAVIEHGGKSVNLDLVAKGHAWHYPQYCKVQPICEQIKIAEDQAREAKRGLWWAGDNPIAPWVWRKEQ